MWNSNNSCSNTYCDSIYVGSQCDASFSYYDANTLNGYSFIPSNLSNTYSHLWTFGDGTSSNSSSPGHTYSSAGVYQVCHTLFDNNGCQDTECYNVVVNDSSNTGC
ncbi:MAG: PKD domain-containing protein [Sphingobacteriales bacterium JAD_PAG50586_3]|nr:MAG: PKD domain-containing protein [Sphingobacteriales bacterium JAD_PAG50586_3]